jgi:hypothetical protein
MKARLVLAAAAVVFLGVLTVTPASAQYVGGTPPKAGPVAVPTVEIQKQVTPVEVQVGRDVTRVTRFAFTGADIARMVLIAGGLVLGGALLVRQGRRRVVPSAS